MRLLAILLWQPPPLRDDFLPHGVAIKHADSATPILGMFSLRCRLQHMGHEVLQVATRSVKVTPAMGQVPMRQGHSLSGILLCCSP